MGPGKGVKVERRSGAGEIVKVGVAWGGRVGTGMNRIRTVEKQEKAVHEISKREIKPISRRPNGVRLSQVFAIEGLVIFLIG